MTADEKAGHIIVASNTGTSILDAHTGAILRTVPKGMNPFAIIVTEPGRRAIVINDYGGNREVSAVDVASGAILHTVTVGQDPSAVAVDEATDRVFIANTADDSVSVLDAHTGSVLATNLVARSPVAVAADTQSGRVFVASSGIEFCTGLMPCSSGLSVLDARTGAVIGIQSLKTSPVAMAIDERTGRIILANGTSDDYGHPIGISSISVLNARTGKLMHTVHVDPNPRTIAIAVDDRCRRAFVSTQGPVNSTGIFTGYGKVYELDTRTGIVLRTISVGVAPIEIAVDQQTQHLVILDGGGAVRATNHWNWAPQWLQHGLPFLASASSQTRTAPASVDIFDVRC